MMKFLIYLLLASSLFPLIALSVALCFLGAHCGLWLVAPIIGFCLAGSIGWLGKLMMDELLPS